MLPQEPTRCLVINRGTHVWNPALYIERRKTGAKRLIRSKKNVRAHEERLMLKKSKGIDARQAGEYAGESLREQG